MSTQDATLVKTCPACGEENSPLESFCTNCDFDLLTVPAEPRRIDNGADDAATATEGDDKTQIIVAPVAAKTDVCRLELLDNSDVFFEIKAGQSVGRGVESDVILAEVPHAGYISRLHARFSRRGAQWFVQYLAQGNFIVVDGETYEDDSEIALHDGSVLVLSLTSFRVVLP